MARAGGGGGGSRFALLLLQVFSFAPSELECASCKVLVTRENRKRCASLHGIRWLLRGRKV